MLGALGLALGVLLSLSLAFRGDGLVHPDDPCATPPPMRTARGVTLQPNAMTAFREAERTAGRSIQVIHSYRSCAQQAAACTRVCQNPGGCPDRCLPPGLSYHQLGAAIDISQAMLDRPEVIAALEEAGWCQSVPDSDPGHFSFGGCH